MIRALLRAMLEPADQLRELERAGDYTSRLALQEAIKQLPFAAVWEHYCETGGVPSDQRWIGDVKRYRTDSHGRAPLIPAAGSLVFLLDIQEFTAGAFRRSSLYSRAAAG